MAEIFFESEQQVWLHVVWCDVEIRRRVRKIEARQQERQIKIMRTLAALFLFLLLIYSLYACTLEKRIQNNQIEHERTMRFIPLLLCVALIIPVATTAGDGTTVTTTKEGSQETQDTETTDCGAPQQPDPFLDTFDLFDSFLPHFPLTFLDRATHSFGLDRDIFRQTRTYEPNSVTMKLVPGSIRKTSTRK